MKKKLKTILGKIFVFIFLLSTNINTCIFSTERGSSAPFISGDTFKANADHVFDETTTEFYPENIQCGDIVFVKTDWEYLKTFFHFYHPRIAYPYVLLTHNSDHDAPGPFFNYLDDPKLLAWFAQNVEKLHPKLNPIPIGIANKCWEHGNLLVFSNQIFLAANMNRPNLCYMNFSPSTYPQERPYVWNFFANQPWCITSQSKKLDEYLKDLSQSKFVLSPRGNGLDCHRTWEALLMGAIPIVRTSTLDSLFSDLPVLIVPNWEIVTESYLNEQYDFIQKKTCDLSKILIQYWINNIHQERTNE